MWMLMMYFRNEYVAKCYNMKTPNNQLNWSLKKWIYLRRGAFFLKKSFHLKMFYICQNVICNLSMRIYFTDKLPWFFFSLKCFKSVLSYKINIKGIPFFQFLKIYYFFRWLYFLDLFNKPYSYSCMWRTSG